MDGCQCENPEEVMYQGSYYCSNCFCQTDLIIYEETLTKEDTNHKTRKAKFDTLLLTTEGLPWYVRQTLMDCFYRIEHHFFDSERINFINMNQLAIELCHQCGYSDYAPLFKSLKTKNRVKQVSQFVKDALGGIPVDKVPFGVFRLEDMPLITCVSPEVDMSKVPQLNHIYSDIDEGRKTSVYQTKGKTVKGKKGTNNAKPRRVLENHETR